MNLKKQKIGELNLHKPKINLDRLREWKNEVVNKMTGGLGQLSKARKINYVQGTASFINSSTLKVEKVDGSTEELKFENAIIATGSRITINSMPFRLIVKDY